MIEIVNIPIEQTLPTVDRILFNQGISDVSSADSRTLKMARKAIKDYAVFSAPQGILAKIAHGDFESVYLGEGNNEPDTPVDLIYPDASTLALFAVTLGEKISMGIQLYFNQKDFAAGSMLDAAASDGAERAAEFMESLYRQKIMNGNHLFDSIAAMRFSPGYCGWHVSGQKKLFDYLQPDKIGLELTGSYLMKPLKSISGVMISGPAHIFEFEDNFQFCANCDDHSCIERMASLNSIKE